MEIQKIFSDTKGSERLYSVLMSEDEISLYSQFQKEFNSKAKHKRIGLTKNTNRNTIVKLVPKQSSYSFLSGFKNWMKKGNKSSYIKSREEAEQERKRKDQLLIKNFCNLSRQHKIIFDIRQRTKHLYPTWGDGDEYPSLILDIEDGGFRLGWQNEPVYRWKDNHWERADYDSEKFERVSNLKQSLLKDLEQLTREWLSDIDFIEIEKDEIDEVTTYLNSLIAEVKKSAL